MSLPQPWRDLTDKLFERMPLQPQLPGAVTVKPVEDAGNVKQVAPGGSHQYIIREGAWVTMCYAPQQDHEFPLPARLVIDKDGDLRPQVHIDLSGTKHKDILAAPPGPAEQEARTISIPIPMLGESNSPLHFRIGTSRMKKRERLSKERTARFTVQICNQFWRSEKLTLEPLRNDAFDHGGYAQDSPPKRARKEPERT